MPSSALLTAPVKPLILKTALPSMLATVASALSALLDALLLARFGTQSTAAAAVSFPLLACIQTLGFTLGMGAGSFVSRCIGDGQSDAAHTAASTAFFLVLGISCLLCGAGFFLAAPLAALLGASGDVLIPAAAYARYVLLSGPLLCASLVFSCLLRVRNNPNCPYLFGFCPNCANLSIYLLTIKPGGRYNTNTILHVIVAQKQAVLHGTNVEGFPSFSAQNM